MFLIERHPTGLVDEIAMHAVPSAGIPTYARKSSAKRAAQKMIERVLDSNAFLAPRPGR